MNICVISFTKNGSVLAKKLYKLIKSKEVEITAYSMKKFCDEECLTPLEQPLEEWTKEQFENNHALIFIGACGIAIRSIAPIIKNKTMDPAVIVIDELGKYVIPILSGHIGGGNELAIKLAKLLGSDPIITTATDLNHKFPVDVFATKNNLHISNMTYAKSISAELLEGKRIGLICEGEILGNIPEYIELGNKSLEIGIVITSKIVDAPYEKTLYLTPRCLSLGIGCKKGKSLKEIEDTVKRVLDENDISMYAFSKVASIELKKSEKGIIEFCEKYKLPRYFYSEKELKELEGEFTNSEFVKEITGVNNVCERAAVKASDSGKLIVKKYAHDGVTVAIAEKEWCVNFE